MRPARVSTASHTRPKYDGCAWKRSSTASLHTLRIHIPSSKRACSAGAVADTTLWAVLSASAAAGPANGTPVGRLFSPPVVTMGISFFLSASGVIPTSSNVYDIGEIGPQTSLKEKTSANMPPGAFNPAIYVTSAVWSWLVPVGTALYLLESDISKLATSGRDMLAAFALGAAGSVVGMLAAWHVVSGPSTMGPEGWKIAAALTASYIGGSINFAAVVEALQLSSAALVAAAFGADNAVMALYLMVMMLIPADAPGRSSVRGARGRSGAGGSEGNDPVAGDDIAPSKPRACSDEAREEATGTRIQGDESVATKATEQTILSGVTTALFACILGRAIARAAGVPVASSAFTAVVAAAGAWVGGRARLFTGARELGGAAMQLLFAVIGAQAGSLGALREAGAVAAFVAVQVMVHACVCLGLGRAAGIAMPVLIIASNSNIGGPATAAAMASARGWTHLASPGMLVGSLGYAAGTGIGILCAALLHSS